MQSSRNVYPSRNIRRTLIEPLEARIAPAFVSTVSGSVASFVGDGGGEILTITESAGFLMHNRFGVDLGFESAMDFDSSVAGEQALAATQVSIVNVNGGGGGDTLSITRSTDFNPGTINVSGGTISLTASGGAILSAGASVTGASLGVTATTGIGSSGTPLTVAVSNIEAHTDTGGIHITNTGSVLTIGGVGMALTGISADSGDIRIRNDNNIILSEAVSNTGGGGISLETSSGNINVNAAITTTGGDGDISIIAEDNVSSDAPIAASGAGDITIIAEPIIGGSGGFTSYVGGTVTVSAGALSITAMDDIFLQAAVAATAAGGTITLIADQTTGPSGAVGNFFCIGGGTVSTFDGNISIRAADSITVEATVTAGGGGTITIDADAAIDTIGNFSTTAAGSLITNGGGIDISGYNAIFDGTVSILAASGSLVTSFQNNITVNGDITVTGGVTLSASNNVVLQGDADVTMLGTGIFNASAGTSFLLDGTSDVATTNGSLSINSPAVTIGSGASLGANVSGNVTSLSFTSNNQFTNQGSIFSGSGNITIRADNQDLQIGSSMTVPASNEVNLRVNTGGVEIDVGSGAAGANFSQAELNTITAGQLRLTSAANITLSQSITLSSANVTTLVLEAVGGIIDGTVGEQTDLTVTNFGIKTSTGIGSADDLDVAVSTLAFRNFTSGAVNVTNSGALTIDSIFDVTTSANSAVGPGDETNVITNSALTVAVNLTSVASITLVAGENSDAPAFADDLTVSDGVTVASTAGNITLRAGDDIVLGSGSAVTSAGALTVVAGFNDLDNGGGISGAGNTTTQSALNFTAVNDISLGSHSASSAEIVSILGAIRDNNDSTPGTVNITATTLSLQASTGIGIGPGGAIEIQVENLEAVTATGGISIHNGVTTPITLNIGGVSGSIDGVQATTSGNVSLINQGSIILDGSFTEEIRTNSGDVLVQASGSGANVVVRNSSTDAIDSNLGSVTISAGQDILLGSSATDSVGSIEAGGNVTLTAGRDVIVDENTTVNALDTGTMTVSAGRDISVLASDGTTGAYLATSGQAMTLSTGAGGTLTISSGFGSNGALRATVPGNSGNITINADRFILAAGDFITAGSGIVTISPASAGVLIDLGSATDAATNTLEISNAELSRITGSTFRIGSATAGAISLTTAIVPGNATTLKLLSGGQITDGTSGSLAVANLAVAGSSVILDNALNSFSVIAGSAMDTATTAFAITNPAALTVSSVDGLTGITATSGGISLSANGVLTINAALASGGELALIGSAGITQTAAIIQIVTGAVTITGGTGAIVLTNPANNFIGAVTLSTSGTETITDLNDLVLAGHSIAQSLTINAAGAVTQSGAFTGAGTLIFNGGTLTLSAANTYVGATHITAGTLGGSGSVAGSLQIDSGVTVAPGASPGIFGSGNITFTSGSTLVLEVNGAAAGLQYDQLNVTGTVDLAGATLNIAIGFTPAGGETFTLVNNDGADAITGTFAGLPNGSVIKSGSDYFRIFYAGGDGNDVVLNHVELLPVTLATNFKSAKFTDADGDIVTVKTSKGAFGQDDFIVIASGVGGELALLNLSDDAGEFSLANISITAKKVKGGVGNGLTDVGYIDSTGFALGTVTVKGDLGQIDANAVDLLKPAIKSLNVQSLGVRGLFTQLDMPDFSSDITGRLGAVTVKANIEDASIIASESIGNVTIKGSFLGGSIRAGSTLGAVKVLGSITGSDTEPVVISAYGKAVAPTKGFDLAIKSLTVTGSVDNLRVLAGYDTAGVGRNADAAIGAILVKTNWSASTVLAGVEAGADTDEGTADDAKITGVGVRDNTTLPIYSRIASVIIKGTATGSPASGDSFGIVAEEIVKAQIGTNKLIFTKGPRGAGDFTQVVADFSIGEATV